MQITKRTQPLFPVSFLTKIFSKEGGGVKMKHSIFMGVSLFDVHGVLLTQNWWSTAIESGHQLSLRRENRSNKDNHHPKRWSFHREACRHTWSMETKETFLEKLAFDSTPLYGKYFDLKKPLELSFNAFL